MTKNKRVPAMTISSIGLTGMTVAETITAAFMSGLFLVYLTDYAGLGLLGAAVAPVILVVGRVIDFIIDPMIGWTIDSAKPHRFGKYRLFSLLSMLIASLAVIFLFSIPEAIKGSQALLFVWVLLFYVLYSSGSSLFTVGPLIQTITRDTGRRSRLATYHRIVSVGLGIVFSFFMLLVNRVNLSIDNFGRSFSMMTITFTAGALLISLLSLLLVKEDCDMNVKKSKIEIRDILDIFRKNNAFTICFASSAFRGLVFTLMTATATYYTKWAYCADPMTGAFDAARLGRVMVLNGVAMLGPMLLATVISPTLITRLGSSIRVINVSNTITASGGLVMFSLQIAGILPLHYELFLALLSVMVFGTGLNFVPSQTIALECIDYNIFKTGKSMAGMINALRRLLRKAQLALSTLAVGLLLAGIGYNVDSATGGYIGDLARLPAMLNGFMLISAGFPAIFSILSILINRFYPITDEIKKAMLDASVKDHSYNPISSDKNDGES